MKNQIEYFPPDAVTGVTSITFGDDPPFILRDIASFAGLPIEATTSRGPFQPGETLMDNSIGGKTLRITVVGTVTTREEYWERRDTLAHAFSVVPRFDQRKAETGLLRFSREGQDDVEIECTPVNGTPVVRQMSPQLFRADIELFAPSPWWRDTDDVREFFSREGGLAVPETDGLAVPLDQETVSFNNNGHVPAPFELLIEGEITDPRLTLVETGEVIGLTGTVAAGETIRINTAFGNKEVTKIDSNGDESNAFDMLDPDRADFFWLQRGGNTLQGTFSDNPSGSIELSWRKRYSGV